MSAQTMTPGAPSTRRVAWWLLRRDPAAFVIGWLAWTAFHVSPVPIGLLLKAVIDHVDSGGGSSVWWLLAALGSAEVARWLLVLFGAVQWHGCWALWNSIPRLNMLRSLTTDPGPVDGRLPGSTGEAVSRFRDDTQNLALVLDVWLDVSGSVLASSSAMAVMLVIDWRVALAGALPVLVALWLCRGLGQWVRRWRRLERESTAAVTGFIGDTFGGVQAVQAAGAGPAIERRFHDLGLRRADAARRDQVVTQVLQTLSGATGNVAIGLMLILLAPRVSRGELTAGDIGLFVAEATVLASLPRWVARASTYHRQGDVSVRRLAELMPPPHDPRTVVAPVVTRLRHGPGPFSAPSIAPPGQRAEGERLDRLEVRGLTVVHPGGGGIVDLDLTIKPGTVTVVTGAVGAGKTTLLRGLLGMVALDEGSIWWNGEPVGDPSTVIVPPRTAYVPQVPRLFSEALSDTVLLGLDSSGLAEALRLACLDVDIDTMPDGLATIVGPKGVRLSGGQIQRTAAARALVRQPELLVVDDLSSALDVATEARMWSRLLDEQSVRPAMLVVSHRPALLDRADQVVVLESGRRVA